MNRRTFTAMLLTSPLIACAPLPDAAAPDSAGVSLQMNYEAAEALLGVLEQRSVTDADIDRLLQIRGVQAMVDNTTKYIPSDTRDLFRAAVKEFVSTRKSTIGHFRLDEAFARAAQVRGLIAELKADPNLQSDVIGPVNRYLPPLGRLTATVYSVVGGASDGFVPDNDDKPAFYMDIHRAHGDAQGVKLNMAHELYHVAQRVARARVPGLSARVFDKETAPNPIRLLTLVQEEGSATHVAAPLLASGSGRFIEMWREAYRRNAPPEKIVSNFAEFDRVLLGLQSGTMSWDDASKILFTGTGSPLYFVGYEVARALDRRHGPARIGASLQQHPAAFFQAYIDLYRACPTCVPARFSPATEAYIRSLPSG